VHDILDYKGSPIITSNSPVPASAPPSPRNASKSSAARTRRTRCWGSTTGGTTRCGRRRDW